VKPDPERDAPFAVGWFASPHGKETLLKMGNPESSIKESTLEGEKETLAKFLQLEQENKQLTWMIRADGKTIGAVWVEQEPTEHLAAPAVHLMIGDANYRGYGIGTAVIREMIEYAGSNLQAQTLFSRYLADNHAIAEVLRSLGFIHDGDIYMDDNGLEWQNVKIVCDSKI
jgi:RimJ/RimL family protein N-acetyltransferase